ncbi:hypothetical protein RvY_07955 [Ramazzottius varieornatus]|uniref:Moesin/ezrin/radixin homolog 1 n=1 Tax=Ramazzottius varieornatus TaxID=947166 RepID=A0A1D1V435_RAMVA|nr:hypothetical protein RvY_07955 [Ramazzottius varieornatus]
MSLQRKIRDKNLINVRIVSMDAELQFTVPRTSYGRDLLDVVYRALGLRETWYFGLQYQDDKALFNWLKENKPLLKHSGLSLDGCLTFSLLVRFYPEDVSEELVQDITQHLVFLQVRQSILDSHISCPPDEAILLASYDLQIKYGDYDDTNFEPGALPIEELLPLNILQQYANTSREAWENRVRQLHVDNYGFSRAEAELEYLKVAQNLSMFGVGYFQISNKKDSVVYLGVTAFGLNIYDKNDRQTPKINFPWSEIKNVSYEDTKFIIRPVDKKVPTFSFYSSNLRLNKIVLDLCMGNHDLFLRRRKPDSIEVQQMKLHAKEERARRQLERQKLLKEKRLREELQREKLELQRQLLDMQEEVRQANEEMNRCHETASVLSEKAKYSEEEATLLNQKALQAEAEVQKLKLTVLRSEEERILMEKKVQEAENIASQMADEAERCAAEVEDFRREMLKAKMYEKMARDRLMEISSTSPSPRFAVYEKVDSIGSTHSIANGMMMDTEKLSAEIERERLEYVQKSRNFQTQLNELKTEIEIIKSEDALSPFYALDVAGMRKEKFATLQKASAGSTKMRISHFENL